VNTDLTHDITMDDSTETQGNNTRDNSPRRPPGALAGMDSQSLVTELDRAMKVAKDSQRQYNGLGDKDRKIHYTHLQIKDHNYYNKTDNLWNEPQRLDPKKFARYSEKNIDPETSFKKNIKDLQKIAQKEKD
jgi:hypothetical protein